MQVCGGAITGTKVRDLLLAPDARADAANSEPSVLEKHAILLVNAGLHLRNPCLHAMTPDRETSADAYSAAEKTFVRLRGAPYLLTPLDWQLVRHW